MLLGLREILNCPQYYLFKKTEKRCRFVANSQLLFHFAQLTRKLNVLRGVLKSYTKGKGILKVGKQSQ